MKEKIIFTRKNIVVFLTAAALLTIFFPACTNNPGNSSDNSEGMKIVIPAIDPYIPATNLAPLKAAGNRIKDDAGNTVVLKGMNICDPHQLVLDGHWNEEYFQKAAEWGTKVLRVPVHPGFWRAEGITNYIAILDKGVGWAESKGMYVIIDWHSIGDLYSGVIDTNYGTYLTTQLETMTFWAVMADHYKNDPGVAFYELFNEPTTFYTTETTWIQWKSLAERIINVIRSYNSNAVALVGGLNWAYDLSQAGQYPVTAGNVIYAVHPYANHDGESNEAAWEENFGYLASTYPVFVTEFAFETNATTDITSATNYGVHIMNFIKSKGMSWTVWVFHPSWTPRLIDDWTFKPSKPEGEFFTNELKK